MFLCPNCGNPYEASAKYCPCCGNATGDAAAANPEDTTFLYCAPAAASASPATADLPTADLPTAEKTPQASQAAEVPVSDTAGLPDMWIPDSARLSAASRTKPVSDTRVFDPEPVTPPDSTPATPIWVTRSMNQPITGPLDESFLDDPSINTPPDENSYAGRTIQSYTSRAGSSASADVDVDIFDEVFETTTLIYSNMPSKLKKIVVISLITTLLSIIPIIYVACSEQKDPGLSKEIQASLTDDWASGLNADSGT